MSVLHANRSVVLAFALLLQACADGGGETGTGVTAPDVSVGTITKFGSVWVNGVEFETGATQVKVEGVGASTSALRLGMVVVVKGKINADSVSGTADAISVDEVIKGPVSDTGTGAFTVLGQQVVVNETTRYEDGLTLASLTVGNFVEVSGIVKSAGVIIATRVERKDSLGTYKLKGIVSNSTPGAYSFMIGVLTINYAGVSGLPSGVPADGLRVEVKGSSLVNGVFVATSLKADILDVADADKFEIEGYVGSVSGDGASFTVNNVTVQTSASTKFSAGLKADLVAGAFVEVEGALQGGVVAAHEVEFKGSVKLLSYAATNSNNALTLKGMSGLIITDDSATEYSGEDSSGNKITSIATIPLDTHRVSVRGRYDASANKVIATHIEAELSGDTKVILQGPVNELDVAGLTLRLMGVSVNTAGISSFNVGGPSSRDAFFAAVSLGSIVNVEGDLSGGAGTWKSIKLLN